MNFISKIKDFAGSYELSRLYAKMERSIRVKNLRNASSIGIIYIPNDEKTFGFVKSYVRLLKQEGVKSVITLGYVDSKQMPYFLTTERDFDYFTKKDLNWYNKPNFSGLEKFTSTNFDILIDLSMKDCMPLTYILALSSAGLKVGKSSILKSNFFDLIINLKEEQGIGVLIKNVTVYLNMLDKKSVKQ